jgi:hypothetical protein
MHEHARQAAATDERLASYFMTRASADMTRFLSRWRRRYGKDWAVAHTRDFNIDVIPEMRPDLVDGLTIQCNNPKQFFG